jgi:predicted DNA-binding protein (MmcQ/YjbR family)
MTARKLEAAEAKLRDHALSLPGAQEFFPWGERAIKVRNKTFLFMRCDETGLGLSVKLPYTRSDALQLPFAEPTGYGLGKSGWVSARFAAGKAPPVKLLIDWITESYGAIAPKTLVRQAAERRSKRKRRADE